MKTIQIELNKTGYEPFLDYLKAYSIICVLISHTIPYLDKVGAPFWIDMQVPIFTLVQAFHVLKKPASKLDFKKMFFRILLPYIFVLLGIVLIYSISGKMNDQMIIKGLIGGGYGPGSYYPWIYIQLAIILHFVRPLFDRINITKQTILWIAVSEGFEVLESCIDLPEPVHRLLAIRYLFLIYLTWRWVKYGIIINKLTILISVLSGLSIAYFAYCSTSNEPLFYTTAWSYHRWPCYFYVSTLLSYILHVIYTKISQVALIDKAVKFVAKCSYEIFLLQMAVIALLPNFSFLKNKYGALVLSVISVWTLSLVGGYLFNKLYSIFLKRIDNYVKL